MIIWYIVGSVCFSVFSIIIVFIIAHQKNKQRKKFNLKCMKHNENKHTKSFKQIYDKNRIAKWGSNNSIVDKKNIEHQNKKDFINTKQNSKIHLPVDHNWWCRDSFDKKKRKECSKSEVGMPVSSFKRIIPIQFKTKVNCATESVSSMPFCSVQEHWNYFNSKSKYQDNTEVPSIGYNYEIYKSSKQQKKLPVKFDQNQVEKNEKTIEKESDEQDDEITLNALEWALESGILPKRSPLKPEELINIPSKYLKLNKIKKTTESIDETSINNDRNLPITFKSKPLQYTNIEVTRETSKQFEDKTPNSSQQESLKTAIQISPNADSEENDSVLNQSNLIKGNKNVLYKESNPLHNLKHKHYILDHEKAFYFTKSLGKKAGKQANNKSRREKNKNGS